MLVPFVPRSTRLTEREFLTEDYADAFREILKALGYPNTDGVTDAELWKLLEEFWHLVDTTPREGTELTSEAKAEILDRVFGQYRDTDSLWFNLEGLSGRKSLVVKLT